MSVNSLILAARCQEFSPASHLQPQRGLDHGSPAGRLSNLESNLKDHPIDSEI